MTSEEIKFLKHCLSDYNFYWKQINALHEIKEDLESERLALAANTSSVIKVSNLKHKEYFDLYSSDKWHNLTEFIADCNSRLVFYYCLIKKTDSMLEKVPEPVRTMLKDIYIEKKSRREISRKHFYSDEKSMYRAIRNTLKNC